MHQNCSCPSCVGTVLAEYYITSPYYNGEAWHRDIPKRKPRRISLIRSAWQHVIDFEEWVYPIHTLDHHQRMVRILAARDLAAYVATDTTQVRLISIERRPPVPEAAWDTPR